MKIRIRKSALITALVVVCLAGQAVGGLAERINGIIGQPSQRGVEFSVQVVKADSGQALYRHNATEAMLPASNMKIITTAAALKVLGPDYEFVTRVGLCDDTLVIIGGGDPLLGDKATEEKYGRAAGWIFGDIAEALKEKGIAAVNDIVVDSSIFDDERVNPSWPKEQLNRWYACEVSGLNFNGNCVAISAKTVGGKVEISVEPATDYLKIINEVAVSHGTSAVGAYRNLETNVVLVKGRCREAVGPFDFAIERPAAFFGYLLAENLIEQGISTKGRLIEKAVGADCNAVELKQYSHSLADCLRRCNKDSFGLAAESLLKTMGAKASGGRNGSWEGGRKVVSEYLSGIGIDESEFYIDDGSGLSRQNELSANAITKVLCDVYAGGNWGLYKGSLASGGVDGTIKRYFGDEQYKGRILGKTGYIAGVKSFSGVCVTPDGDYIFSILANGANGRTRAAINDIAKAIMDDKAGDDDDD